MRKLFLFILLPCLMFYRAPVSADDFKGLSAVELNTRGYNLYEEKIRGITGLF